MNEIFGLSMTTIMVILLALLAISLGAFLGVFLANRVMFRIGLRNMRRRRAQSALIVSGLMLATVIITAAFTTGDVVDYSVTKVIYDNLQRTDLSIHHFQWVDDSKRDGYADQGVTAKLEELVAGDPDIEGVMPFLYDTVAVLNPRTRLSEPAVFISGFDAARLDRFGGLHLLGGGRADLAGLGDDEVLIGKRAADKLDAVVGDTISVYTQVGESQLRVAGIVKDERASGTLEFPPSIANMAVQLAVAQRITGLDRQISTINVALRGGVRDGARRTDAATARLEAIEMNESAKAGLGLDGARFQVERIKQEATDGAKLAASMFTAMFLVLGLFSIAAGAMLIFTLFVMLAAERRTDMGIARAVGAQRSHLVQTFISEGMVYDLLAGVAGVALGVAAALVLVVGGARLLVGDQLSFISPYVTARSLVVSFSLGVVLTFVTVAVSSVQVSRLNIVAAVRGQGEGETGIRRWAVHPLWIVVGIPALVLFLPLGVYLILGKGLGLPWGRIAGPGGVALAALLIAAGLGLDQAFFFTTGASVLILSGGTIARQLGVPARTAWSSAGGLLAIYWLAPQSVHDALFGKMSGGMELFVVSGIMIVTGFTLLIVFNARLLTTVFASQRRGARRYGVPGVLLVAGAGSVAGGALAGDVGSGLGQLLFLLAGFFGIFAALSLAAVRFPRFAPALKMGIAYPLASRFRTGMTIAMFSIVVFSITVMGILNASMLAVFASDEGRGGWDILVFTNRNNPVGDLPAALREEGSFDASSITATGRVTSFDNESQEARVPGRRSWVEYPIIAGDDGLYRSARMKLDSRARGYDGDQAVYDALRSTPGLAIVDSSVLQQGFMGGNFVLSVDITVENGEFDPFQLELHDKVSGRSTMVTVVGVLSARIPGNLFFGIYTNEATYQQLFGPPEYQQTFLRLAPGTDARTAAKGIKAALVTRGVQAVSLEEAIDDVLATSRGFLRIFQAFMALGLFVGIAALGVIALRSVVERRQQIGMLRAIGYQRGTVALSFLLESGFIAMMGILSGVVGAALLAWNLLTSGYFAGASHIEFFIPWTEVLVYTFLAFVFALAMTWWPSRRAASVPVADALRYE